MGESADRLFVGCWLWAAFTPAIIALARRFPCERKQWGRNLVAHITAAIGFTVLDVLLTELVSRWIPMGPPRPLLGAFFSQSFLDILSYFAVVAIAYAVDYRAALAERTMAAARLEAQLLSAQLRSLEMQIHPHFLFNTLHAISSLAPHQPDAADRMISRLERSAAHHFGSIADRRACRCRRSLSSCRSISRSKQTRFHDRLDGALRHRSRTLDAEVPRLILQPLVENAIKHGVVSPMPGEGLVQILARRDGDRLWMEVERQWRRAVGRRARQAAQRRRPLQHPRSAAM